MLEITSVSGNINDMEFGALKDFECLRMSRTDLEKSRIRRDTDRGTDVGLLLEPGTVLNDGDVFLGGGKTIIVRQMPEKVITVRLKNADSAELQVLVGHIIGNRHRPISVKDGTVYFPIQGDSELEVFEKLFAGVIHQIELGVEEKIFRPHAGANVHDH